MIAEQRNQWGFPIIEKLQQAKQYAAEVRARDVPCDCATCRQIELLPAVLNITKNWRKQ